MTTTTTVHVHLQCHVAEAVQRMRVVLVHAHAVDERGDGEERARRVVQARVHQRDVRLQRLQPYSSLCHNHTLTRLNAFQPASDDGKSVFGKARESANTHSHDAAKANNTSQTTAASGIVVHLWIVYSVQCTESEPLVVTVIPYRIDQMSHKIRTLDTQRKRNRKHQRLATVTADRRKAAVTQLVADVINLAKSCHATSTCVTSRHARAPVYRCSRRRRC